MRQMSNKNELIAEGVAEVIRGLHEYWPLTLRQIYYQLVSKGLIQNNVGEYKKLSVLLSKARFNGIVPWEAMEDRSRRVIGNKGFRDYKDFMDHIVSVLPSAYKRNLLQSQKVGVEIWVEKDALSQVLDAVASQYSVPVIAARGFSSVSFKYECAERIKKSGLDTIILYFGDMDPSGYEMLPAMMRTLHDEFKLYGQVETKRCALTME